MKTLKRMCIIGFKQILVLCFLLLTQIIFAQEAENAESEDIELEDVESEGGVFIIGLGPTYELEEALYGMNARLYYGINESFCFGPEISYFPYQEIAHDLEAEIIDLNLNAHYIFELSENLGAYPLTGINYTIEKEREIEDIDESETENEFGLNYGFGAHYKINDFFIFSEFKGIIGNLSDEFITVGMIYEY